MFSYRIDAFGLSCRFNCPPILSSTHSSDLKIQTATQLRDVWVAHRILDDCIRRNKTVNRECESVLRCVYESRVLDRML